MPFQQRKLSRDTKMHGSCFLICYLLVCSVFHLFGRSSVSRPFECLGTAEGSPPLLTPPAKLVSGCVRGALRRFIVSLVRVVARLVRRQARKALIERDGGVSNHSLLSPLTNLPTYLVQGLRFKRRSYIHHKNGSRARALRNEVRHTT